jgi:hypothetical protein
MADTNPAARRKALRRYVAEFVTSLTEQDEIIDATLGRAQTQTDDRWYTREEIAWRWIDRLQHNPHDADAGFEVLNRLFWNMVFGRVRGRLRGGAGIPSAIDGDAEQLAVDTFTRCFQQRHTLNRRHGSLGGYLQKVAGDTR